MDPYETYPSKEVKGVATSEESAEILIENLMKRIPYERKDFDIREFNLDGKL